MDPFLFRSWKSFLFITVFVLVGTCHMKSTRAYDYSTNDYTEPSQAEETYEPAGYEPGPQEEDLLIEVEFTNLIDESGIPDGPLSSFSGDSYWSSGQTGWYYDIASYGSPVYESEYQEEGDSSEEEGDAEFVDESDSPNPPLESVNENTYPEPEQTSWYYDIASYGSPVHESEYQEEEAYSEEDTESVGESDSANAPLESVNENTYPEPEQTEIDDDNPYENTVSSEEYDDLSTYTDISSYDDMASYYEYTEHREEIEEEDYEDDAGYEGIKTIVWYVEDRYEVGSDGHPQLVSSDRIARLREIINAKMVFDPVTNAGVITIGAGQPHPDSKEVEGELYKSIGFDLVYDSNGNVTGSRIGHAMGFRTLITLEEFYQHKSGDGGEEEEGGLDGGTLPAAADTGQTNNEDDVVLDENGEAVILKSAYAAAHYEIHFFNGSVVEQMTRRETCDRLAASQIEDGFVYDTVQITTTVETRDWDYMTGSLRSRQIRKEESTEYSANSLKIGLKRELRDESLEYDGETGDIRVHTVATRKTKEMHNFLGNQLTGKMTYYEETGFDDLVAGTGTLHKVEVESLLVQNIRKPVEAAWTWIEKTGDSTITSVFQKNWSVVDDLYYSYAIDVDGQQIEMPSTLRKDMSESQVSAWQNFIEERYESLSGIGSLGAQAVTPRDFEIGSDLRKHLSYIGYYPGGFIPSIEIEPYNPWVA